MSRIIGAFTPGVGAGAHVHRHPASALRRHWKQLARGRRGFCAEAKKAGEAVVAETEAASVVGAETSARWIFRLKRLAKIGTFFGVFGGGFYYVDKNNLAPKWAMEQLKSDTESTWWLPQYLLMGWSWSNGHATDQLLEFYPDCWELLDEKYPAATKAVALFVITTLLCAEPGCEPEVEWSKGLAKLRVIGNYGVPHGGKDFFERIFARCIDLENPEVMLGSLEILVRLTQIPKLPSEADVKVVMKLVGCPEAFAHSALVRYQDMRRAVAYLSEFPKEAFQTKRRPHEPPFHEIKPIIVRCRGLEFALQLYKEGNPLLKNYAMMLIYSIVGGYPDREELLATLSDDPMQRKEEIFTMFECLLNMGSQHLQRDENQHALMCFLDAKALCPEHSMTDYVIAQAYKEMGNFEEAKSHYAEALAAMRGSPDVAWDFAQLLVESKDPQDLEEASELLEGLAAMRGFGKREKAVFLFLRTAERLGRHDDAYRMLLAYAAQPRKNPKVFYELGRMGNAIGEFEGAKTALTRALELEPFATPFKLELATSCLKLDDFERVESLCNEVVQAWPDDAQAWVMLSQVRSRRADWSGTVEAIDNVIKTKNHIALHHYHKALALERMRQKEEAQSSFEDALSRWYAMLQQRKLAPGDYFGSHPSDLAALERIQHMAAPGSQMEQQFNALMGFDPDDPSTPPRPQGSSPPPPQRLPNGQPQLA